MTFAALSRGGDNGLNTKQVAVECGIDQSDGFPIFAQHRKTGEQRNIIDNGFINRALLRCAVLRVMNGIEPFAVRRGLNLYINIPRCC